MATTLAPATAAASPPRPPVSQHAYASSAMDVQQQTDDGAMEAAAAHHHQAGIDSNNSSQDWRGISLLSTTCWTHCHVLQWEWTIDFSSSNPYMLLSIPSRLKPSFSSSSTCSTFIVEQCHVMSVANTLAFHKLNGCGLRTSSSSSFICHWLPVLEPLGANENAPSTNHRLLQWQRILRPTRANPTTVYPTTVRCKWIQRRLECCRLV